MNLDDRILKITGVYIDQSGVSIHLIAFSTFIGAIAALSLILWIMFKLTRKHRKIEIDREVW